MPDTLVVNEIYLSLQGESTFAGLNAANNCAVDYKYPRIL
jgi:hypothetical protein